MFVYREWKESPVSLFTWNNTLSAISQYSALRILCSVFDSKLRLSVLLILRKGKVGEGMDVALKRIISYFLLIWFLHVYCVSVDG